MCGFIVLAEMAGFCKVLLIYVRQPSKQRSQSLRKIQIKRHVLVGGTCVSLHEVDEVSLNYVRQPYVSKSLVFSFKGTS